jgi:integrase
MPRNSNRTIKALLLLSALALLAGCKSKPPITGPKTGYMYSKLPEKFMLKTSRHSCASALINEPDVPLKAISARLGHASIRTTADIYGVVDDERGRQVSERIGQLFGIGKK